MKTIVMKHFNGILFHKSGPANKQHIDQSINQSIRRMVWYEDILNPGLACIVFSCWKTGVSMTIFLLLLSWKTASTNTQLTEYTVSCVSGNILACEDTFLITCSSSTCSITPKLYNCSLATGYFQVINILH